MILTRQTADPQRLRQNYQRIVSLVPSQTELLYHLGLEEQVAGITTFCIHPKTWFETKTRVGGTKRIHFDRIHKIHPDLIIANKEENEKEQIENLAEKYMVWLTDVNDLNEAMEMIMDIGTVTSREERAAMIIKNIEARFSNLVANTKKAPSKTVAYFIWQNPLMIAASDTFIDDMLGKCGLVNAFKNLKRYPALSEEELSQQKIDFIFLSSEPYPFAEKHVPFFRKLFPESKILLVDGEMFSWYGSRLQAAPRYFLQLLEQMKQMT